MAEPREKIEQDMKAAMKAGEKEKVATLRLLLSAITNERIRAGAPVDEAGFLALVQKAIKQRAESAEQYRNGGREELATKEEREAALLEAYLPAAVPEAEIRTAIEAFVAEKGLSGPAGIGPIMKEMLGRFAGRTDGATINRIARDVLAG
jgi:hypothetical protein